MSHNAFSMKSLQELYLAFAPKLRHQQKFDEHITWGTLQNYTRYYLSSSWKCPCFYVLSLFSPASAKPPSECFFQTLRCRAHNGLTVTRFWSALHWLKVGGNRRCSSSSLGVLYIVLRRNIFVNWYCSQLCSALQSSEQGLLILNRSSHSLSQVSRLSWVL